MKKLNQQGQILVVMVSLMVLALSVGIAVSTRFVESLRTFTRSDNSAKALFAAEAAAEKTLMMPDTTLKDYIKYSNCGTACTLSFPDGATASVALSLLGNSTGAYALNLKANEFSQITLDTYSNDSYVDVCWNEPVSMYGMYVYKDSTNYKADSYAVNSFGATLSNGFSNSVSQSGYTSCFRVTAQKTPVLLRLKPFGADTECFILPATSKSLPGQGILIEATGTFKDTIKKVTVVKKNKAVVSLFDYSINQNISSETLSN